MKPDEVLCCMFFAFVVFTVHKHNWAYNTADKQNRTCPGNLYQYSNMAPRLSGQNYKCLKFFFFCLSIPKRDLDTKKTPPYIEVCPESLGAMSEY